MSLITDLRFALRSLARVKGLALTVIVTLALGIGANAAIFSVVRGVLLRPLVNRDEDRLIYIRQSAPGIGSRTLDFSVPELRDLQGRVKTLSAFGDFSTIDVHHGRPGRAARGPRRASSAARTSMSWGCGRCWAGCWARPTMAPQAAGAAVLTHRFWTTALDERPVGARQDHQAWRPHRRRSSASSSHPCRIPPKPRSSRTSSPARIIWMRRWWTGACTG